MASTASAKSQLSEAGDTTKVSSVPALCLNAALKHAKPDALNHKKGDEWVNIPAETFVERVRNVAEERKRSALAQEKLDQLRAVERSLLLERSRNAGGAGGGGGGGTGR